MSKLYQKVDVKFQSLESLMKSSKAESHHIIESDLSNRLPVQTLEQFLDFEHELSQNANFVNDLVRFII